MTDYEQAAAGCFCVIFRHGIWEVTQDGKLCAERPDRSSAVERARELASTDGAEVWVFYSSGRLWWKESANIVVGKSMSNN